jgi:hypothetical protein
MHRREMGNVVGASAGSSGRVDGGGILSVSLFDGEFREEKL